MRLFSINLTGNREFYVSQSYRELADGDLETTGGVNHDITADVRQWLVKAQRDMCQIILDKAESSTPEELVAFIRDEISRRE